MPQTPFLNPRMSIRERCRQWHQTQLRADLEVSLCAEDDDEGVARIVSIADANLRDIEGDIIVCAGLTLTMADALPLVSLARSIGRPEADDTIPGNRERADALLSALHRGLTALAVPSDPARAA